MGISVITSTNREYNLNNVLNNFLRQNYNPKELIILLNYDNPKSELINQIISQHSNVSIYSLGSSPSLGRCLNFGISKARYNYISKFDDDDYYGPKYLNSSLNSLIQMEADIVGKSSIFIYFKEANLLGIKNYNREKKFVNRVEGSTLFFKKSIMKYISFKNKSLGEDIEFCKDALNKGFKIYSADKYNYVYIRSEKVNHTWKIHNDYLIRECVILYDSIPLDVIINCGKIDR